MDDKKNALLQQLRAAVQQHLSTLTEERASAVEKMQALGANDDEATLNMLILYLSQEENELLRPLAASRLSEIGDKRVVEQLLKLLEASEDSSVRGLVLQVLGDIADSSIAPIVAKVLAHDSDSDVRQRAGLALGKIGSPDSFEALANALENDEDVKVRQQVIVGLGFLRDARIVPDLVQIMETDEDKETRTFAAEALGRIGAEACFLPLVDALTNETFPPIVRYYAAHALGIMADRRAIPHLEEAVNNSHSWIAQMATESLEKIQAIENH